MEWIETPESSNISRFKFEPGGGVLTIEFSSGATYDYFDVPSPVFEAMKGAASKGQFLAQTIKGSFRYARR